MKKKLQLQIIDPVGNVAVTHHFFYHAGENNSLRLTITDNEYVMDSNGKLVPMCRSNDEKYATEFKGDKNEPQYFNKETGEMQKLFDESQLKPIADSHNVVTGTTKG